MPRKTKALIKRAKSKTRRQFKKANFFVHHKAEVEKDTRIGSGTKIWHFSHIRAGTKIGKNCIIGKGVFIDFDSEIGNNVKIQNHAIIYHKAIISDSAFIGPNVCFTNDKLPRATNPDGTLKSPQDWQTSTIKVKEGASVGAHSVILPNIEIGRFAMIGSGSVVTKNVPDFALVYGNPAQLKGFVCACGKKLKEFIKKDSQVVGKCLCGLESAINIDVFKQFKSQLPKKRIWLR